MTAELTSAASRLVPVADDIWIIDDQPIHAAGLTLPIRMTIVRLTSGDLLLHSPTRYSTACHQEIERLGRIRYLVAPNIAHWLFVNDWQRALPRALLLAVPGLAARRQVRVAKLRIDGELTDEAPDAWQGEIQTILVTAGFFREVALFHRLGRTLILTDLVQNIPPAEFPAGTRWIANILGITAPDGRAPLYLRMLLRFGGRGTREAAARLIELAPDCVIFAHGDIFRTEATRQLRHALRWFVSQP